MTDIERKLRDALQIATGAIDYALAWGDKQDSGCANPAWKMQNAKDDIKRLTPDPTPVEPEDTGEDVPEPDWDRMRNSDEWPRRPIRDGLLWLKAHLDALEKGRIIIASPDVTMPDESDCSTAQPDLARDSESVTLLKCLYLLPDGARCQKPATVPIGCPMRCEEHALSVYGNDPEESSAIDLAGETSDAGLLHAAEKVKESELMPGTLVWNVEGWTPKVKTIDTGFEKPPIGKGYSRLVLPSEVKVAGLYGRIYGLHGEGRVMVEEKSDEKS